VSGFISGDLLGRLSTI